jgi:hypothetical protein
VTAGSQPARLARLLPQKRGRRGGRGELTAIQLVCCTPRPQWGEGDMWWGGCQSAGGELLTRRRLAAYILYANYVNDHIDDEILFQQYVEK